MKILTKNNVSRPLSVQYKIQNLPQNNWSHLFFTSLYNDSQFSDKFLIRESVTNLLDSFFCMRSYFINKCFFVNQGNSLQIHIEYCKHSNPININSGKKHQFVNNFLVNSSLVPDTNKKMMPVSDQEFYILEKVISKLILSPKTPQKVRLFGYSLDPFVENTSIDFQKFSKLLFLYPTSQLFSRFISSELSKTKSHNQFIQRLKKELELQFSTQNPSSSIRVLGFKFLVKGRLGNSDRKKLIRFSCGQVPTQTIASHIEYGHSTAETSAGLVSFHIWVYWSRLF